MLAILGTLFSFAGTVFLAYSLNEVLQCFRLSIEMIEISEISRTNQAQPIQFINKPEFIEKGAKKSQVLVKIGVFLSGFGTFLTILSYLK